MYFPHSLYGEFDLDDMEDDECLAEFQVRKRLSDPCRSLQILESFNCRQRSKMEWYGGIEHVTETVTYPCGCADMLQRFGMPLLVLSVATNTVLDYMYDTHGHFLTG